MANEKQRNLLKFLCFIKNNILQEAPIIFVFNVLNNKNKQAWKILLSTKSCIASIFSNFADEIKKHII